MSDKQDQASSKGGPDADRKTPDLGGRRRRVDRRGRATAAVFPERRWLRHRREGGDRRSFPFFNSRAYRERREIFRDADVEKEE